MKLHTENIINIEEHLAKINESRANIETIASAVYYAEDDISSENIYHSLNLAASVIEQAIDAIYAHGEVAE